MVRTNLTVHMIPWRRLRACGLIAGIGLSLLLLFLGSLGHQEQESSKAQPPGISFPEKTGDDPRWRNALQSYNHHDDNTFSKPLLPRSSSPSSTPTHGNVNETTSSSVRDIGWFPVPYARSKVRLYSAFHDDLVPGRELVRIIGVTRTRAPLPLLCRYHDTEGKPITDWKQARVRVIRENWGLAYSACYISCPLDTSSTSVISARKGPKKTSPNLKSVPPSASDRALPWAVSLTTGRDALPSPPLRINQKQSNTHQPQSSNRTHEMEICVKPLYNTFDNVPRFLEFIEFYRLLGATHFTFYNSSIGPQVDCIAREYIREGLIQIHPWKLDIVSQKEIRTEGIFAALNDCLYRTRASGRRFAAMVDIDEYLIPGEGFKDLVQLLDKIFIESPNNKDIGSVSFQNGFHYLYWGNDPQAEKLEFPLLLTQLKTRRAKQLHRHRIRSKYIVDTNRVVELGNHFVWEYLNKHYRAVKLTPEQGISHHYRICEYGGHECTKTPGVTDSSATRYSVPLARAVRERYETSMEGCGMIPIDQLTTPSVPTLSMSPPQLQAGGKNH